MFTAFAKRHAAPYLLAAPSRACLLSRRAPLLRSLITSAFASWSAPVARVSTPALRLTSGGGGGGGGAASTHIRAFGSAVNVARDTRFATLCDDDVAHFRAIIGDDAGVVTDADLLDTMNEDWQQLCKGHSKLALRPRSTEQVSAILKHAHARRLAVVPQGGNTGLCGGGVPVHDEVILSLASMNRIVSFDAATGVIEAEVRSATSCNHFGLRHVRSAPSCDVISCCTSCIHKLYFILFCTT
jgi:hypothetical protein